MNTPHTDITFGKVLQQNRSFLADGIIYIWVTVVQFLNHFKLTILELHNLSPSMQISEVILDIWYIWYLEQFDPLTLR